MKFRTASCFEGGLPDVCSKSSGSGIGWNAHLNQAIAAEVNEVQWPFGRYFGTHQLLKLDIGDRNIAQPAVSAVS